VIVPAAIEMKARARLCTSDNDHVWMVEGRTTWLPVRVAQALVKPQDKLHGKFQPDPSDSLQRLYCHNYRMP